MYKKLLYNIKKIKKCGGWAIFEPKTISMYLKKKKEKSKKNDRAGIRILPPGLKQIIMFMSYSSRLYPLKLYYMVNCGWFKLYFNCYKYTDMETENTQYPGSDKKPKACHEVISWQADEHVCTTSVTEGVIAGVKLV